jgi:hypothetical protein
MCSKEKARNRKRGICIPIALSCLLSNNSIRLSRPRKKSLSNIALYFVSASSSAKRALLSELGRRHRRVVNLALRK